jgi:TolA-binding protein
MKTRLMRAATCVALLMTAAPAALAQGGSGGQPKPNIDKMDRYIKSYQDAVKYYQTGQFKLAEKELLSFLEHVGEHAGGNFLMGLVQIELQDLEKARTSFRTAVKLDATMVAPHGYLGAVEAVLGNPQGAVAQKAALEKMKADCAGKCPKASEIDQAIQRIDENVAEAAATPAKPS